MWDGKQISGTMKSEKLLCLFLKSLQEDSYTPENYVQALLMIILHCNMWNILSPNCSIAIYWTVISE